MRVLLIGGGVGALSTALALEQAGIEARVFERSPQLRASGGVITLWANALRVLRGLGLLEAVLEAGVPLEVNEYRSWRGELLTTLPIGALSRRFGAPSVNISRSALLRILASRLSPSVIETGAACTGFHADAEGATAFFTGRTSVRGELLVGADGIHSTVRAQLFGPEPPRPVGQIGWFGIAECRHRELPLGVALTTLGLGCRFWASAHGRGQTFWYATVPEGYVGDDACQTFPELRRRFRGWHTPIQELLDSTPGDKLFRTRILDRAPLQRWGHGRVTLLGDAAHPSAPDLGQGACQSIESAVVLARCLRQVGSPHQIHAALRVYEAKRMYRTAVISRLSLLSTTQVGTSHPLACLMRELSARVGFREVSMEVLTWLLGHVP